MKYIRTKNGIYDIDESTLYEFTGHTVRTPYCEEYEKQPELCKTADTIKELCDEFVIINPDIYEKPTLCYGDYEEYKDELHKEDILYGAIWTDKGLIYVAKMNEEGELELL